MQMSKTSNIKHCHQFLQRFVGRSIAKKSIGNYYITSRIQFKRFSITQQSNESIHESRNIGLIKTDDLNKKMRQLAREKADSKKLIDIFENMKQESIEYDGKTFLIAQKAYIEHHCKNKNVSLAKKVWNLLLKSKYNIYLKEIDYHIVMKTFINYGYTVQSLIAFKQMIDNNIKPNSQLYQCAITAVCDLKNSDHCSYIHNLIIYNNDMDILCSDPILKSNLLSMYLKCGDFENGQKIFESINKRDLYNWNILIDALIDHNKIEEALQLYDEMKNQKISPNEFTHSSICKGLAKLESTEKANSFYEELSKRCDIYKNRVLCVTLIHMFGKCNNISKANEIWDYLYLVEHKSNVLSNKLWNAIIQANFYHQNYDVVMDLYNKNVLARNNISSNNVLAQNDKSTLIPQNSTYQNVIETCGIIVNLNTLKAVHLDILDNVVIGRRTYNELLPFLLDSYVKCLGINNGIDKMKESTKLFDNYLYSLLINKCIDNNNNLFAFELFDEMQNIYNIKPNSKMFILMLNACDHESLTKEMHQYITKSGNNIYENEDVLKALIRAYKRCGNNDIATKLKQGISGL